MDSLARPLGVLALLATATLVALSQPGDPRPVLAPPDDRADREAASDASRGTLSGRDRSESAEVGAARLRALVGAIDRGDVDARSVAVRRADLVAALIDLLRERVARARSAQADEDAGVGEVERALASIGTAAVGPLLAAWDADDGLAGCALRCFARMGADAAPSVPAIAAVLRASPDERTRALAISALRAVGRAAAASTPDLRDALLDVRLGRGARADAARALVAVDGADPDALDGCRAVLADSRSGLRVVVLESLATLGADAAPLLPVALALLDDPDHVVARRAAALVGAIGAADTGTVASLSRSFVEDCGSPGDSVRPAVGAALVAVGADGIAALLRVADRDADVDTRLAALLALARGGAGPLRDHVDLVTGVIDGRVDAGRRSQAIEILRDLAPPVRVEDALPSLERLPIDESKSLTIGALRAAATLVGDDRAVARFLLRSMERRDPDVVTVAASLLARFPTEAEQTIPPLVEVVVDLPDARSAAYHALRTLLLARPAARPVVAAARARAGADAEPWLAALLDARVAPDDGD